MMPIKRGSVGPEVTVWQVALNDASHTKIAVDGVFGRGTEKAIANDGLLVRRRCRSAHMRPRADMCTIA